MQDVSELIDELKEAKARLLEYGKSIDDLRAFFQAFIDHTKRERTGFDIHAAGWATLQFWCAIEFQCLTILYMACHEGTVLFPDVASQLALDLAAAREGRVLIEAERLVSEQLTDEILPNARIGRAVREGGATAHGTEADRERRAERLRQIDLELPRSGKQSKTWRSQRLATKYAELYDEEISYKTVQNLLKRYASRVPGRMQDVPGGTLSSSPGHQSTARYPSSAFRRSWKVGVFPDFFVGSRLVNFRQRSTAAICGHIHLTWECPYAFRSFRLAEPGS